MKLKLFILLMLLLPLVSCKKDYHNYAYKEVGVCENCKEEKKIYVFVRTPHIKANKLITGKYCYNCLHKKGYEICDCGTSISSPWERIGKNTRTCDVYFCYSDIKKMAKY